MKILGRLKVDPEKLAREPEIMEIIDNAARDGREQVLKAMRFSADPVISDFFDHFDKLPASYRKIIPWQAVALWAGLGVRQLLGAIIIALREYSNAGVKIAALTSHTDVTNATIHSAMLPGAEGHPDRKLIHEALGFSPLKKGQTINFNFDRSDDGERRIEPEDVDMDKVFPDISDTLKLIDD